MDKIKKKIEDYVRDLLYLHDMSIRRNEHNKCTNKCS